MGCTNLKENSIKVMESRLKNSFSKIKDELNDHRECLNQNTNEIQGNYEYLCRLESKIDKLTERLDEISLFLEKANNNKEEADEEKFTVSTLTRKEQEVFMAIYIAEAGATYADISKRTGLNENLIVCYVTNLIAKGVPLMKRYLANGVRLYIEEEFKRVQAQKNILQISESVAYSII